MRMQLPRSPYFNVHRRLVDFFLFVVHGPRHSSIRRATIPRRRVRSRQPGQTYLFEADCRGRGARAKTGICTRAMPLCSPWRSRDILDVPALRRHVDVTKGWVGIGQPRERILLFRPACMPLLRTQGVLGALKTGKEIN